MPENPLIFSKFLAKKGWEVAKKKNDFVNRPHLISLNSPERVILTDLSPAIHVLSPEIHIHQ
jgi:hypothetical protein